MNWNVAWDDNEEQKAPPPITPEEQKLIEEAKKRFTVCADWEAQARILFDYDYKFANGDTHNKYQWDNDLVQRRELDDRPCLTINKTAQHNLMVINDAKQNKPGVRIRPVGDDASFEGAQIFQEIIYHIEYISSAENVYDHATTFQVQAGMGYWRINTDYISERSFDQEIYIQQIKDPRSVYLDPDINQADGLDSNFGFIFDDMPKETFAIKYPEFVGIAGATTLNQSSTDGWITRSHVKVCEYFKKEQKDDKLVTWTVPNQTQILKLKSELEDTEKVLYREIKAGGNNVKEEYQFNERKVIRNDINWYKIAGDRVIDQGKWLGKYIPIVRLPGTETVIDGILDRKGHTRALINAQQIYNYNCLDLNTKLPTPTGWTTIREVKENDYLLDDRGLPTKVLGISPININRKCYKINFDTGESIIADANHLWTVEERGKAVAGGWQWLNKTITTKELVSKKHFIHVVKPVSLPNSNLLINPYVLGVWLGDGSTDCNRFTCDELDAFDMISNLSNKGYEIGSPRKNKGKSAVDITIHGLRNDLIHLNLLGNKYIPNDYLRSSENQRLALLQGLMDTDGCINKINNQCIFTNTNKKLTDNIIELISSLGIKCAKEIISARARKFPNGETYNCQEAYRITFSADPNQSVFKLPRKLNIQQKDRKLHWRRTKRHGIKSIIEIPSVPVKCLTVDSASKLFLASERWIPTHNTSANVEYGALQTKSPWIAPVDAIEGFEEYYQTANSKNHSFMPYNHMDETGNPIPAPSRPQAPQASPAYVEQLKIAQEEMMMVSGQYQAQFGEQENAKSGVAINARQRQGDRATYHFIDNLGIAIRATGKILIDLIPKIYDTKRVKRIQASDGSIMNVTIDPELQQEMQNNTDPNNQQTDKGQKVYEYAFNPDFGLYDIQADTGPSFATKRMEAIQSLTQIATTDKNFMNVGGDIYFSMLDFPKADVLADRYKKMIPSNITGDAPDPHIEQAMHAASDKIEQMTALLAKQSRDLASKEQELAIKEREITLREKEVAVEQQRLDYEAETKRLTALGNSGPAVSVEQIQPVVRSLLQGMIKAGEFGAGDAIKLKSLNELALEQAALQPSASTGNGESADSDNVSADDTNEAPPVPGARKAPDGNFYLPDSSRPGKYLKVNKVTNAAT